MSRFQSYLNSAASLLQHYKGPEPFSNFVKSHFAQHKKFGSRDRKQVAHLCYCFFRLGNASMQSSIEERILTGLFLCEQAPNELLEELKPEWNELIALPADAKASMLGFSLDDIFPWGDELSNEIDVDQLSNSFLIQPDLFLRIRPRKESIVPERLHRAGISFNVISQNCISLHNSINLENVLTLDEEAVVQDYNSQRVREFLDYASNFLSPSPSLRVYDCCAASGGKSILALDVLKNIELTVSDIRESILVNLRKRFSRAGINRYDAFALDLTSNIVSQSIPNLKPASFDLLICDAPCTGSGTWSRTPEQLYFFRKERIDYYTELQEGILTNVLPFLKKGGLLLYITCSLFKRENEQMIEFLEREHKLQVKKLGSLIGYDMKADTMFASLLMKS